MKIPKISIDSKGYPLTIFMTRGFFREAEEISITYVANAEEIRQKTWDSSEFYWRMGKKY